VDIDRIQLSWTRPVLVEGLRMHEASSSSSRQLVSIGKISSAGMIRCDNGTKIHARLDNGTLAIHAHVSHPLFVRRKKK
jgi:hypothetical protein